MECSPSTNDQENNTTPNTSTGEKSSPNDVPLTNNIIENTDVHPEYDALPGDEVILSSEAQDAAYQSKKKYSKISNDQRHELINSVENNGQKIKDVAQRLSINYSSAKSIYQVYKREGRTDKKAFKKKNAPGSNNDFGSSLNMPNVPISADQACAAMQSEGDNEKMEDVAPEKDSLAELRDRLMESRLGKRNQPEKLDEPKHKEGQTQIGPENNNNNNNNVYYNGFVVMNPGNLQHQDQIYMQAQPQQLFVNFSTGQDQVFQNNVPQNQQNMQQMNNQDGLNGNSFPQQQNYLYFQPPQQHYVMANFQPQAQNGYQGFTFQQAPVNTIQQTDSTASSQSNQNNQASPNSQGNQGNNFLSNATGQGQYYTMNNESNNMQIGYQYMQPIIMMMPNNPNMMQQGYFTQNYGVFGNNYNPQQGMYVVMGDNQNQNPNPNQGNFYINQNENVVQDQGRDSG